MYRNFNVTLSREASSPATTGCKSRHPTKKLINYLTACHIGVILLKIVAPTAGGVLSGLAKPGIFLEKKLPVLPLSLLKNSQGLTYAYQ